MNRPLLKFCGNRSFEDVQLSFNSTAAYLGFIFYRKSPRYVESRAVSDWLRNIDGYRRKKWVGVFVNPSLKEIADVLSRVHLDIIQLHGNEHPEWITDLKRHYPVQIWKAIHHEERALNKMQHYEGCVEGFVIDCKAKGLWGGTGQSFDWSAIPGYKNEAARQRTLCFIAGGVSPKNIDQLLSYQPMGIDIASGIEHEGRKSKQLILDIERKVETYYEYLSR